MTTEVIMALIALQVKHWYVDFVIQTPAQIQAKGEYGKPLGILHSLYHFLGTFIILLYTQNILICLQFALLDGWIHYHVDWLKVKFGCKDITKSLFWTHFGLDQYIHQATYLMICWFIWS